MEELDNLNEQLIKCQQELIGLYRIRVGLLEAENKDLKRELTRMMLTDTLTDTFEDAKKKGD